jgi:hypothetical protein
MDKKLEVAAAAGKQSEVVELLDKNLGVGDQAWVVCEFSDCVHFIQGHCNIYMIHNVPRMLPGRPCFSFEKRQ